MSEVESENAQQQQQPITVPPGNAEPVTEQQQKQQLIDESQESVNWWSGWGSSATKWSKTLTDVSSNVTKSVSYGLELANQVLDKEIEIEIDVDKVTNQVSTLAAKTVQESKKIIENTTTVVEKGVNIVTEDVTELSAAIVEDTQAGYSAISSATYDTITKVGGTTTAATAVKMKDSIFGGINAFASVLLADTSDESDDDYKKRKVLKGPEARLNQLRISPATYCNEPEDINDYLRWLIDFDLESDAVKAEISDLLVETPQVRSLYSKLVPEAVAHSDFWQRYYYRLNAFNEAEMRRSRLVERATTDEDEELDSWGSDDEDDEKKEEEKTEDNVSEKSKPEDIGPDGNDTEETLKTNQEEEAVPAAATDDDDEVVATPEIMKNSTASSTKTEEKSESKESDWTNVEKSESDDWEADFSDADDNVNDDAKKEPKTTKPTESDDNTETGEDWDDWS